MHKLRNYSWPGNVRELQHAVERAVILGESNQLGDHDFLIASAKGHKKPSKPVTLDEMEEKTIREAMVNNEGNMSRTARELGITRATLYRKMEKYGI